MLFFPVAETKRIIAAGGWVEFNRVNGRFGNHECAVNLLLLV